MVSRNTWWGRKMIDAIWNAAFCSRPASGMFRPLVAMPHYSVAAFVSFYLSLTLSTATVTDKLNERSRWSFIARESGYQTVHIRYFRYFGK